MTTEKCPKCGSSDVKVVKTWNLVSPLPDKLGRITITVMGVLKCNSCGYSWKSTVSKLKVGGGIEAESKKGRLVVEEEDKTPPKEIVLDIGDILQEED
ncbi:MAG: chromatin protein Cren7 [Desulfurococcaceae archaeon]